MNLKILKRSHFRCWTNTSTLWAYIDSLDQINHASYLKYMESVRSDFFCSLRLGSKKIFQVQSIILGSIEVIYFDLGFHLCNFNIGNEVIWVERKSFDIISSIFIDEADTLVCNARFYLISFNHRKKISIEVPKVIQNICFTIDE